MDWTEILFSVVGVILTALASWAVAKLTALIDSKVKDGKAKGFLNTALSIITDVVKQTYQTCVESLKAEGKFDASAQKAALEKAVNTIKGLLSEKVQSYIAENYGDAEKWITTQVESAIYSLKNATPTTTE